MTGFDPERLSRIDAYLNGFVERGQLPGWSVQVSRKGAVAHSATGGMRDVEAGLPVEADTVFRIYSMTKPITSVALMMLYEEGAFELTDPVSRYIPAFGESRVYRGGTALKPITEPLTQPIRIWHLLTHTAGLTYGFHHIDPIDEMYRIAGLEWGMPRDLDLGAVCDLFASLPLLFQPGSCWVYSVATDVVGRLVEVLSGQTLEEFFAERIFAPLGMTDTHFGVPDDVQHRLAALYSVGPSGKATRLESLGDAALRRPKAFSGGGGLVSTMADYHRFTQMLLGEGALDGVRLLGPRTLRYMTRNHLPRGVDLEAFGRPLFSESSYAGMGFGLGFAVLQDPVAYKVPASAGEFGWGGAASTVFWVDPVEQITVEFMTQLMPSSTHPIRSVLRQLVMAALVS